MFSLYIFIIILGQAFFKEKEVNIQKKSGSKKGG